MTAVKHSMGLQQMKCTAQKKQQFNNLCHQVWAMIHNKRVSFLSKTWTFFMHVFTASTALLNLKSSWTQNHDIAPKYPFPEQYGEKGVDVDILWASSCLQPSLSLRTRELPLHNWWQLTQRHRLLSWLTKWQFGVSELLGGDMWGPWENDTRWFLGCALI